MGHNNKVCEKFDIPTYSNSFKILPFNETSNHKKNRAPQTLVKQPFSNI